MDLDSGLQKKNGYLFGDDYLDHPPGLSFVEGSGVGWFCCVAKLCSALQEDKSMILLDISKSSIPLPHVMGCLLVGDFPKKILACLLVLCFCIKISKKAQLFGGS